MNQSFLQEKLRKALRSIFGIADDAMLSDAAQFFEWKDLPGGSYLFRKNDSGDAMYFLASGRLKVLQDDGESIAEIPAGEPVGEMALITGEPRNAHVLAMRDCILAKLEKPAFDALARQHPEALLNICKTIVERLQKRQRTRRRTKSVTNLCILPLCDAPMTAQFLGDLVGSLAQFGSILVLDSHSVNRLLALPEISQAETLHYASYRRLSAWLDEQESQHRFVIYVPDAHETEWSRRCIRQADEIMILADATSESAELHLFEKKWLENSDRLSLATQTLVMLHPADTQQPVGTRRWLSLRPSVSFHHHTRLGNEKDTQRIARFLTGTAVGLVLSGGAAKGIAHIGVLRALQERSIEIDMVGGTSIGAIVGSFVCLGWSGDEIRERTRQIFLKNPTNDFNLLPIVSIFKGKKLERLLNELFLDRQIEDFWLNFYCISCNLSRTNPRVHRSGRVAAAIRASASIPGVFPPAVLENDELYIDGGVFNNMPVDEMIRLGAGKVIAVDLQQYHQHQKQASRRASGGKMPNLLYVIMESSMLSGRYLTQEHRQDADLYFNPDLTGIGMLDWQKFDKIEAAGYHHACEVLGGKKS